MSSWKFLYTIQFFVLAEYNVSLFEIQSMRFIRKIQNKHFFFTFYLYYSVLSRNWHINVFTEFRESLSLGYHSHWSHRHAVAVLVALWCAVVDGLMMATVYCVFLAYRRQGMMWRPSPRSPLLDCLLLAAHKYIIRDFYLQYKVLFNLDLNKWTTSFFVKIIHYIRISQTKLSWGSLLWFYVI